MANYRKRSKGGLIGGIAIALVVVLLVGALGFVSGGFRNWDVKEWYENLFNKLVDGIEPTIINCDGTLGQEVEIINQIQADIDAVDEETSEYTTELSYKLDGTLNVSAEMQFTSNMASNATAKSIMAFDFLSNPDCEVTIDFSDCELTEKTITIDAMTSYFIIANNGGTLNINDANLKFNFTAGSTGATRGFFYSVGGNTMNLENCKTDGVFTNGTANSNNSIVAGTDGIINAVDCVAAGNHSTSSSINYRAYYAFNSGVINATGCTTGGDISGSNMSYSGYYAANGGQINAIDCTTGGSSSGTGSSYNAFFSKDAESLIKVKDSTTGGASGVGASYYAFFANGGKIDITDCTTGGSAGTSSSVGSYLIFSVFSGDTVVINCKGLYVNTPTVGTIKMSLGTTSTYSIKNSRFPNRTMNGIPQTDTTTGTQIWTNNTYA